jgi:hypothetical protein
MGTKCPLKKQYQKVDTERFEKLAPKPIKPSNFSDSAHKRVKTALKHDLLKKQERNDFYPNGDT